MSNKKKVSGKDKKDWDNFISSDEKLPNKDHKTSSPKTYKTKSIDLHGYTLDQANKVIKDFINQSYIEKVNKLIVVTGKGIHSQNKNMKEFKDNFSFPNFNTLDQIL